ncbi:MAG TPA: ATP-binding protein [Chloroflexia bacterium]|nr:ATP-binding protein [Chloroflexia bacterium]
MTTPQVNSNLTELEALILLAALPDGLALTDVRGQVIYINKAASQLLSLNSDEVSGIPLETLLGEVALRARNPEKLQQVIKDMKSLVEPLEVDVRLDVVISAKEVAVTEEHNLRLSLFPVLPGMEGSLSPDGQLRLGLLIHDTTPDRTAEQLKNEFIAVVSHELRTPLSAIQGFSELLLTQDAAPERRRIWLEMINRESVRLTSLLDDMMSLSGIESGRIELRLERVDLNPLVRQCVEILRIGTSKHSFKLEIEENLPAVRVDRDKLVQILNNIIGNAIKYSTNGGQIVIKACYALQDSGAIQVSVSDQGVGIPHDELSRIFEKFYRVQAGKAKEVKGTGLGLAITHKLVELMGGRIWVESEMGKGSTFHFTLPAHMFPQRELQAFKEILLKTLLVHHKDTTEAELYLDYLHRTLPASQMDEVLRDALYEVGEQWQDSRIGVGDEHFATNIIREFLSRVRPNSLLNNGLRLVIGGVPGEEHVVGITMVANAFARAGWNVTNLGANVPVSAFITTLSQAQPDVLLLSVAMSQRLTDLRRVIREVHETFPDLIIGIGGRLFHDIPDLAQRLGANFHATDPDETVRMASQVVTTRKADANSI